MHATHSTADATRTPPATSARHRFTATLLCSALVASLSEIFPTRVRARGQALGSFTHWIMAAGISWTFPIIAAKWGGHRFAFYAACMIGQLIWVLFAMPETKGISLEQIQKKFGIE